MAGTNKFMQWDKNGTNMYSDTTYAAQTAMNDGVAVGEIADPDLHNKLFYQISTMCSAWGQVFADLGYDVNDSSLTELTTIFKNNIIKDNMWSLFTGDFHSQITNGFYATSAISQTNAPNATDKFYLIVAINGTYIYHLAMSVENGTHFYNVYNGSVWEGWSQLAIKEYTDNTNVESTGSGVISGLIVTAQSTPNMTVKTSAGIAHMPINGRYSINAVASIIIDSAHSTLGRKDLIYINTSGQISYIAGTPATIPLIPTTPTNCLSIANIIVVASETEITNIEIIDTRVIKNLAPVNTLNSYNYSLKTVFGEEHLSAFHKKLIAASDTVVSLSGDSTTEGYGVTTPYKLDSLLNYLTNRTGFNKNNTCDITYLNRGHGGKATIDWKDTYLAADLAENPDLYIVRWGLNDPGQTYNRTVAQTIADLRAGLATIRATKTESQMSILLMTPNSTYSAFLFPAGADLNTAWHEEINPLIRQAAIDYQCCFIDTYGLYKDSKNGINYYDNELIHPNDSLNSLIVSKMFNVMFPELINNSVYLETPTSPTFLNGWVNYGTPLVTAGYYKDTSGTVHLRGCVKSGTIGMAIFNLPSGYRPLSTEIFAVDSGNSHGKVTISSTGGVVVEVGNALYYVNLSGISFRTDI